MHRARRLAWRAILSASLLSLACSPAAAQGRGPRMRVDSYVIDAELIPKTHKLVARAKVNLTALDDISVLSFDLHNALRPTKVVNAEGQTLSAERVTQDSTLRIALPTALTKDQSGSLTFDYEGVLVSGDESPVEGLKLAYVGEDTSYLLYAGRWFPVAGYGVNRFAATMNITVPAGMKVIGSGLAALPKTTGAKTTYTFHWPNASFPGTILAGQFEEVSSTAGGIVLRGFVKPERKAVMAEYLNTASQEFQYFSGLYGAAPSRTLNVVELPTDTVPATWGPELIGLASYNLTEKTNYRLLANMVARQWWGVGVSGATRSDTWIVDGFARYSEVRYVESVAGAAGFEEATRDMAVGALAYDTIPLSGAGRLDPFSAEFQSLVTDKGGMVLHMLRWVVGEQRFDPLMREFYQTYTGKTATTDHFRAVAQKYSEDSLVSFFAQWMDGTGAPEFKNKYSIYRVKKGFRVVGEVSQDLDLFRMPMEVRVDTDGQPEMKRIEVVGVRSPYVIETFGKPRRITLDPNHWVLKNSDELRVRVSVLRGLQLVQQGDYAEALKEYQKALAANSSSSLAHYRIAEVFFLQRNYQAAANEYRDCIEGDGEPKWTEVWSYVQLGKIYDVTGQRERAVNEYRKAIQTGDVTGGALDEARRYLETPYTREKASGG
jgi:predicted negative regulator of RcsB-dependent stress response